MRTWVVVAVVALLGPRLLKLFLRWYQRARMQRIPIAAGVFSIADEGSVPEGTRRGFDDATASLARMGFVPVGHMQVNDIYLPEQPALRAVLWHPTERAFATLTFRPTPPPIGLAIDFVTLLEDGSWVWTEQGRRHLFVSDFESGRLVDTLAGDVAERWELHRGAVAAEPGRHARDANLADLCAFHSAREHEENQLALARGDLAPTADPRRFHFTPAGARAYMRRVEEGTRRVVAAGVGAPDMGHLPAEEQERHYRMAERVQEVSRGGSWRLFGLSMLAFAASMLLLTSWSWLAWIVPVLLFHELGHWAAMRLLGHRDAWIAFIPFFGAATITAKRFEKLSHEIIVFLAGPVPGIVLAFGLTFLSRMTGFRHPFLSQLATLLFIINLLNLLPVHPLDGGRIVHALVTAGRPMVSLVLKAFAPVVFIAAGLGLNDPVLLLLSLVTGFGLWHDVKRARIEAEIRRTPGFAETTTAEERRRFIFAALKGRPQGAPAHWLGTVRLLEVPLSHTKPGRLSALLAGVAYVGLFGFGWFALAMIGSSKAEKMRCPTPRGAITLSCEAPTLPASAWSNLPPPMDDRLDGPISPTREGQSFTVAAFVWCALPDEVAGEDLDRLLTESSHSSARFCTTLPWEKTDDGIPEEQHLRSRSTLAELRRAAFESEEDNATAVDAAIARARGRADFDVEVARLYREMVADWPREKPEAERAIGDRLGRSPTRSCDHLRISNVSESEQLPSAAPAKTGLVQFSVRLGKLEDFAPLGRYLCERGCRVKVLPLAADDARARYCF